MPPKRNYWTTSYLERAGLIVVLSVAVLVTVAGEPILATAAGAVIYLTVRALLTRD